MEKSDKSKTISFPVGSTIEVLVLQALPDLILVSFQKGTSEYQGILLDSSKGHLPCGIYPPGGSFPPSPDLSNGKLFSVKQRHSYFCQDTDVKQFIKTGGGKSNQKSVRPSVRLRPRQVLCSACQSVCNEKNESVGTSKNFNKSIKESKSSQTSKVIPKSSKDTRELLTTSASRETKKSVSLNAKPNKVTSPKLKRKFDIDPQSSSLVPKIKKLKPCEIELASSCALKEKNVNLFCDKVNGNNKENCTAQDKVPKLKLAQSCQPSANTLKKVPKVKISTVAKEIQSKNPCYTVKTRSRANSSDVDSEVVRLDDTCNSSLLPEDEKIKASDNKKLCVKVQRDLRSRTIVSPNGNPSSELSCKVDKGGERNGVISPVPKVTILPFGQKKVKSNEKGINIDFAEPTATSDDDKLHSTPLLKICIGPDGNGRIMNMSPKLSNEKKRDEDTSRRVAVSATAKVAKRALKRARKEAQRKTMLGGMSPSYSLIGGMSPRFGGMSPMRFSGGMSPARHHSLSATSTGRHSSPGRMGGASPAQFCGVGSLSPAHINLQSKENPKLCIKKHKHKLKHKKKHKNDKKLKSDAMNENISNANKILVESQLLNGKLTSDITENVVSDSVKPLALSLPNDVVSSERKSEGQSLSNSATPARQKLSLSIKRVSNNKNEYIACDSNSSDGGSKSSGESQPLLTSCSDKSDSNEDTLRQSSCQELRHGKKEDSSSCNDDSGVPNFPSETTSQQPLLKFRWRNVQQFDYDVKDKTSNERTAGTSFKQTISVGDVVWGKILGFPWWPGKVVSLRVLEDVKPPTTVVSHDSRISWFGSSTTSCLEPKCLQPFLSAFKQRYTKKKRGPYRAAVKAAMAEAEALKSAQTKPVNSEKICEATSNAPENTSNLCTGTGLDDSSSEMTTEKENSYAVSSFDDSVVTAVLNSSSDSVSLVDKPCTEINCLEKNSPCEKLKVSVGKSNVGESGDTIDGSCGTSESPNTTSDLLYLDKGDTSFCTSPGANYLCDPKLGVEEPPINVLCDSHFKEYPKFKTSKIDKGAPVTLPSLLRDFSPKGPCPLTESQLGLMELMESEVSSDNSPCGASQSTAKAAVLSPSPFFALTDSGVGVPLSPALSYSGQSPDVRNSPGEPRLGSPAPALESTPSSADGAVSATLDFQRDSTKKFSHEEDLAVYQSKELPESEAGSEARSEVGSEVSSEVGSESVAPSPLMKASPLRVDVLS